MTANALAAQRPATEQPVVAVLDYGIGNLRSAQKALQRVGADARLTADHEVIERADAVVLPGVGAFGACVDALRSSGLWDVARAAALDDRPFLGICIGMQLLFEGSDESPGVEGLGALAGQVRRLTGDVKLPQMQWNQCTPRRATERSLLVGEPWMYFVHSYAAECDERFVSATCDYGGPVVAMVEHDRLWATQFHPEKSGTEGLDLLRRFVDLARVSDVVDRMDQ